jgi:cytochrome c biogenesis protein CcmG/thiol:disulfide interchange protein DsbE
LTSPEDTPAARRVGIGGRIVYLLPLVLFAAVAGWFLAQLWHEDHSYTDSHIPPSALIGRPAPPVDLPPLYDGAPRLTSADLRGGGPVLVNFFASWCIPCRAEQPLLMDLARQQGVTLHGIAYKDEPAKARAFLAAAGNPFSRIGVDRDGRLAIDFGLTGVPETYVIDAQGRVRYRAGPINPEMLEKDILPLLRTLKP